MTNAELIKGLRWCADESICCDDFSGEKCPYFDEKKDSCSVDEILYAAADALEAAEKRIAELEAQMPKRGEWIEDDTTYCGADRANYKCSLCGKIGGTWKRGLTQDELPNYCPNCGAKMKTVTDCHTLEEGEQ